MGVGLWRNVGRNVGAIKADAIASTVGNMVVDQVQAASVAKSTTENGSMSSLYGVGGNYDDLVRQATQQSYSVDAGNQFAWSANGELGAVGANAGMLGVTPERARELMAADNGPSIVGLPFSPAVEGHAVPYPQISVSPLPESGVTLAQTEGGFWRGLTGNPRNVFEAPAPLSEKIGAGVRKVGEFIAGPSIEVGNQYRDLYAAANGATGGWSSGFAQQVSVGNYGAAALTEVGAVAGTVPLAGAAFKGVGALAPTADLAFEGYAAKTGILSYAADSGFVVGTDGRLTVTLSYTPLAGKEAEFMRQLAGQEAGLNRLTAGEIQSNIDAFNATGRPSSAAQAVAEFRRESPVSGDPFAQAYFSTNAPAPRLAALHEPDMVIGGRASGVTGYGDLAVNSSIGAQNRYLQADVYRAVSQVPSNSYVRFIFGVDK